MQTEADTFATVQQFSQNVCVPHVRLTVLARLLHNCTLLAHRGKRINLDTAVDVAMRPASYKPDQAAQGAWPSDKQGYTVISQADTADNWAKHQKQWVKHETTFTAPSDAVSLLSMPLSMPLTQ